MGVAPLDYGPVLLRKPFGSRLTTDTLPSGCPCGRNPTGGASPWQCPSFPTSCPRRVRHGRVPQPTRHYPRLWIHRPSSERSRDFNPPDQNAAQHTLFGRPTPRRAPRRLCLPAAAESATWRTSNFHGQFLSTDKIHQTYPDAPGRTPRRGGASSATAAVAASDGRDRGPAAEIAGRSAHGFADGPQAPGAISRPSWRTGLPGRHRPASCEGSSLLLQCRLRIGRGGLGFSTS
jgi:hypothetical protein